MRMDIRFLKLRAVLLAALVSGILANPPAFAQQNPLIKKTYAEGLSGVHGVACHPDGTVYVSQESGQISAIRDGRAEDALAAGWKVDENLPRWAISDEMPREAWMAAKLDKPGPITIATNGTIYVAEQVPNGRLMSFVPDEKGRYSVATCIPVPWLDQQFQWHDVGVDAFNRLFIVGMDERGSDFMKFGSALMRDENGDWWVIDFGPFARYSTFAISARQDAMILGDQNKGNLTWWEINRHIMMGGSPDATGRSELKSLAFYPDGSFVLGQKDGPRAASVVRMDPFSGQQTPLVEGLSSLGDIEMDRRNNLFYITDPEAGKVLQCSPNPPMAFTEVAMRQIVRSIEGVMGAPTEAPAFLNTFFDRLQDAAKELTSDDSTHAVQFNLSDIAGKLPLLAGRIRTVITTVGAEEDPIDSLEFFLLFPSKIVMTEEAATPSLSFFSLKRKSGKLEQTTPIIKGDIGVYRLSGTNFFKLATASGGIHVPVVACGMKSNDDGVEIDLSFMGGGIYDDYYLSLHQSPRQQTASLVVKSDKTATGTITYEATFMEEAIIEGMHGQVREQMSNLLISGFSSGGGGANRSVGWLRLGKFPAQTSVAFGDADAASVALAGSGNLQDVLAKKELELRQTTAEEVVVDDALASPTTPETVPTP